MSEGRKDTAGDGMDWFDKTLEDMTPSDLGKWEEFKLWRAQEAEAVVRKSAEEKRAKRLGTMKRWRADHREQQLESMRKWRLSHKDRMKAYGAAYYRVHAFAIRKRCRDKYAATKKAKKVA